MFKVRYLILFLSLFSFVAHSSAQNQPQTYEDGANLCEDSEDKVVEVDCKYDSHYSVSNVVEVEDNDCPKVKIVIPDDLDLGEDDSFEIPQKKFKGTCNCNYELSSNSNCSAAGHDDTTKSETCPKHNPIRLPETEVQVCSPDILNAENLLIDECSKVFKNCNARIESSKIRCCDTSERIPPVQCMGLFRAYGCYCNCKIVGIAEDQHDNRLSFEAQGEWDNDNDNDEDDNHGLCDNATFALYRNGCCYHLNGHEYSCGGDDVNLPHTFQVARDEHGISDLLADNSYDVLIIADDKMECGEVASAEFYYYCPVDYVKHDPCFSCRRGAFGGHKEEPKTVYNVATGNDRESYPDRIRLLVECSNLHDQKQIEDISIGHSGGVALPVTGNNPVRKAR